MNIKDLKENIRLLVNKIRIWWLGLTTDRVRHFKITDPEGKEHKATTVTEEQKVCDHKQIEEIAPTMWRCMKCPDVYFEIGYKILLTHTDLVSFTERLAEHLGAKLAERNAPEPPQK